MTDFQKFCVAFAAVAGIFLATGFAFKFGHRQGYSRGFSDACAQARADTIVRVDTVVHNHPVERVVWKDKLVYVPVTDSVIIHQHDTTYVALEFEKVEYADSTYKAVVSGFQPSLDWIEVYQRTVTIEKVMPAKRRHLGFGVTVGPGAVWSGEIHAGFGAVAGVQFTF